MIYDQIEVVINVVEPSYQNLTEHYYCTFNPQFCLHSFYLFICSHYNILYLCNSHTSIQVRLHISYYDFTMNIQYVFISSILEWIYFLFNTIFMFISSRTTLGFGITNSISFYMQSKIFDWSVIFLLGPVSCYY